MVESPTDIRQRKSWSKYVDVAEIRTHINSKLKLKTLSKDQKIALCIFLETVLHRMHRYQGFGYNFDWNAVPEEERREREYERHYY